MAVMQTLTGPLRMCPNSDSFMTMLTPRKPKKKAMTTAEAAHKRWRGVSQRERKAVGKMLAEARKRHREERKKKPR